MGLLKTGVGRVLGCNQRIKFSGKNWEVMEDGEKGEREGEEKKGEGLILWRGDER